MASKTENQILALIKSKGWFLPRGKKRDRKEKMVFFDLKDRLTNFLEIKNQYLPLIKSTNFFETRKDPKFGFEVWNSMNVINVDMFWRAIEAFDNLSGLERQVVFVEKYSDRVKRKSMRVIIDESSPKFF